MTRFYFDVVTGSSVAHDDDGVDFPGLSDAAEEARASVLQIAAYKLLTGSDEVSVIVRGEHGQTVLIAKVSVTVTSPNPATMH